MPTPVEWMDKTAMPQNYKLTKSRSEAKTSKHYEDEHPVDKRGYCESCHAVFGTHQGAKVRDDA